ncbi:hypothetical protein LCGC14_0165280 [marine sediment metagenome]|uniref:Uncharacterized protein n=1 Tax=marine sediment metagenome TaxID=412755 RepID=A0A0F9UYT0_9ZZZZ
MLTAKQRALLYNEGVDAPDAVLLMLGGQPMVEGLNKGDSLIVTRDGVLRDYDTEETLPAGDYVVSDVASGWMVFSCAKDNSKHYHVNNRAIEAAIAGNEIRFDENLDEGPGRKPGTVTGHPGQIRAMFKKGHLKKGKNPRSGRSTGKLEYRKRVAQPQAQPPQQQQQQQQPAARPSQAPERSASGQRV